MIDNIANPKSKEEVEKRLREDFDVRLNRFLSKIEEDDYRFKEKEWDWMLDFIEGEM